MSCQTVSNYGKHKTFSASSAISLAKSRHCSLQPSAARMSSPQERGRPYDQVLYKHVLLNILLSLNLPIYLSIYLSICLSFFQRLSLSLSVARSPVLEVQCYRSPIALQHAHSQSLYIFKYRTLSRNTPAESPYTAAKAVPWRVLRSRGYRRLRCLEPRFPVRSDSSRHRFSDFKSHDSNRKTKNRLHRC